MHNREIIFIKWCGIQDIPEWVEVNYSREYNDFKTF